MQALDTLALHLPSKHILPEALAFAHQAIHSPEPHIRHAACSVALVVTEGCADMLKQRLPDILQVGFLTSWCCPVVLLIGYAAQAVCLQLCGWCSLPSI